MFFQHNSIFELKKKSLKVILGFLALPSWGLVNDPFLALMHSLIFLFFTNLLHQSWDFYFKTHKILDPWSSAMCPFTQSKNFWFVLYISIQCIGFFFHSDVNVWWILYFADTNHFTHPYSSVTVSDKTENERDFPPCDYNSNSPGKSERNIMVLLYDSSIFVEKKDRLNWGKKAQSTVKVSLKYKENFLLDLLLTYCWLESMKTWFETLIKQPHRN